MNDANRDPSETPDSSSESAPARAGDDGGLLGRWARRKAAADKGGERADPGAATAQSAGQAETEAAADVPFAERIDPGTGKPMGELSDADMPAIESLGPGSDLSVFWGGRVSPDLRRRALRAVWRQPRYNQWDHASEYARDYTRYQPLQQKVTHDMRRQWARRAERLAETLEPGESTPEDAATEARDAATGGNEATAEAPPEPGGQSDRGGAEGDAVADRRSAD